MSALGALGVTVGWELELLAPRGASRRTLAQAYADRIGGTVHRIWLPQSEPSKVPGQETFENLTLGFEVRHRDGSWALRCVDDLTLQADLRRQSAPEPGWYRVVGDDLRLLRLVTRVCDADAPLERVLDPIAALFGTEGKPGPGGMVRVADDHDLPIAIAVPLPGERHRPCEVISPPLPPDQSRALLTTVLELCDLLAFTVPRESATHLHLDASVVQSARALRDLVRLWNSWGPTLKQRLRTNPACVRLGPIEAAVVQAVEAPGFVELSWTQAREALREARPSKYRDVNLRNLAFDIPGKGTLELRVLPTRLAPDAAWHAMERLGAVVLLAQQGELPRNGDALWSAIDARIG